MSEQIALLGGSPSGVEWSATYLSVTDPSLPFEAVEAIFQAASLLGDAARWILGDVLVFAENRYGEAYAQMLGEGRVSERQLSRYRYVCERVVRSRRRENLSFSHHEEVAPLEPAEQSRLLDRASAEDWTIQQLREGVRNGRAVSAPQRPRQEVLGAPAVVEADRRLSEARGTLVELATGLEPETAEAAGIPQAIRALDDVGATVRRAAEKLERPSLVEAGRRVVAQSTRSSGFAMIPLVVFEEFAALIAAE